MNTWLTGWATKAPVMGLHQTGSQWWAPAGLHFRASLTFSSVAWMKDLKEHWVRLDGTKLRGAADSFEEEAL